MMWPWNFFIFFTSTAEKRIRRVWGINHHYNEKNYINFIAALGIDI